MIDSQRKLLIVDQTSLAGLGRIFPHPSITGESIARRGSCVLARGSARHRGREQRGEAGRAAHQVGGDEGRGCNTRLVSGEVRRGWRPPPATPTTQAVSRGTRLMVMESVFSISLPWWWLARASSSPLSSSMMILQIPIPAVYSNIT